MEAMTVMPPVVVTATHGANVYTGLCQTGQTTVTFTNQGTGNDPALSIIKNLSLGIAFSNAFSLQDNAFSITGIRIAGVNIPNFQAMNALAFTTDPDGTGGLTDADGDGFFDDLPLGQSVQITAFYIFNCQLANTLNPANACMTSFSTALNARMAYEEVDGSQQVFTLPNFLRPAHEVTASEQYSDPDAFLGGNTFYLTHRQTRSVRFFENNCTGGQFIVRLPLPSGISAVADSIFLLKNGNVPLPLLSSNMQGDTLVRTYNATVSDFLSGDYVLRLALKADCTFPTGPSTFPVTLEHRCPTCNCSHLWYCGTLAGPQMHATAPPCPPAVVPPCADGLQTLGFEALRTTFGFSDAGFTQPFNPQLANRKVALGCDSVQMKLTGIVGQSPVTDSIGLVITYGNPNGTASSGEIFQFAGGTLRIVHNGTPFNCPVSPNQLNVSSLSGKKTMRFDLASCLPGLGIALAPGDSLVFTGNFYVNPDGPFLQAFEKVPELRGWFFRRSGGTDKSCDHFGDTFTLGKASAVYVFPNSMTGMPAGCNDGEITWRLFVPNNDFSGYFGNELRQAVRVDSIVFDFDPGILQAFENVALTASIPGHPLHGNGYFPIRPLSDFPDGHYVARFDTLAHTPSLNVVKEYIFDLKAKMSPTCSAGNGNASGDGNYAISSKINYKGRYYAGTIGSGSCVEQKTETALTTLSYKNPPTVSLSPITPSIAVPTNDEAVWEVNICNTSNAGAGLTWLAVEDPTASVTVTGIAQIPNPANPVPLNLLPYGQHVFAYTGGLSGGQCVTLRIRAAVNGCSGAQFKLRSGWNCGPFSQPNWTPALNQSCPENTLNLGVASQGNAPVEVHFTNISATCGANGEEIVTLMGMLTSSTAQPSDVFTITITDDEDGDGLPQPNEPTLAQFTLNGAVAPANPLFFNETWLIAPEQACRLVAQLTANSTDLCGNVIMPLPVPQLKNAGSGAVVCAMPNAVHIATLGQGDCTAGTYLFSWSALPPATVGMLNDPASPSPTLTFDPGLFLGETLSFVLETQRPGCGTASFDTVHFSLPAFQGDIFGQNTYLLQAANCQGTADFCLEVPSSLLPGLTVSANGSVYSGPFTACGNAQAALPLPPGNHEIILTDAGTGCADTAWVLVACAVTDTIVLDLLVGQTLDFCLNGIDLPGPVVDLSNVCPTGNYADVELQNDTCLTVTGLTAGQDIACLVACDASGFCDTTILIINVLVPVMVVTDTVFIFIETGTYCPEPDLLPGAIMEVTDVCPDKNGDVVVFTISSNCVSYYGISEGIDTACLRIVDVLGNVALVNLVVTVIKTTPATFCDTLFVGQTRLHCLDRSELPGVFDPLSLREFCPDARTGNVNIVLDSLAGCLRYTGDALGTDSTCFVFCDDFGYCDTAFFCLTVIEYPLLPGLGDDTAYTVKNTPVVIDFLANDTLFGGIVDIFILDNPLSGIAVLNLDNSFTYTPVEPFCARWDFFTYVACNPNGCDTARVSIFIECIELTVFTAVSPNNDGVNDVFYVARIEDFPDNRLWVYNRWGALVYETTEYKNTWPGNWGDSTDLPDGTYFFILEWKDGEAVTVQRGYIELFR